MDISLKAGREWIVERFYLPIDSRPILSTTSKGDQSKWLVEGKWYKENSLGYEHIAEYVATLVLKSSNLPASSYVTYTPCLIEKFDGTTKEGCYSHDFRGTLQEVSLERLFESNFETSSDILQNNRHSTEEKFHLLMEKIYQFTGLDVSFELSQMLAFDAFILNEDRHTNNILFLYHPDSQEWKLSPLFDHGLSLLSDVKDFPLHIPINVLKSKVKSKPFTSSFKKQLNLYQGAPFINRQNLLQALADSPYAIGRAGDVIKMQLNDPSFQRLLVN